MRAAVGRSIFAADGIGRTSKPAAREGEPADRRASQRRSTCVLSRWHIFTFTRNEESRMRIQTYLDESHSRHFDLVGGGDNPWSIDLVVEAVSCILLGGFIFALVAVCIH
jgi:hypothetical protein